MTKLDLDSPSVDRSVGIGTSVIDGRGIEELKRELIQRSRAIQDGETGAGATLTRTLSSLEESVQSIGRAVDLTRNCAGDEIVAAELRIALDELGKIVGTVYTDDILDRIFSQFCIGK